MADVLTFAANKTINFITIANSSRKSKHLHDMMMTVEQMNTLSFLYLTTSLMSLLGTCSVVGTVCLKGKAFLRHITPLFHLMFADLLASVMMLVGTVGYHMLKNRAVRSITCQYLSAVATCLYFCTFNLTVNYALEVFLDVRRKLKSGQQLERGTQKIVIRKRGLGSYVGYMLAWGLPIIWTLFISSIDSGEHGKYSLNDNVCSSCLPIFHYKNSNCQRVYPESENEPDWYEIYKYSFLLVLGLSNIGLIVIYTFTYKTFKELQYVGGFVTRRQRSEVKSFSKKPRLFCAVFLVCWLPSMILGTLSLFPWFEMDCFFWLYVIQACTTPLQGFCNSIIYGWNRKSFLAVLNENAPLLDTTSIDYNVEDMDNSGNLFSPTTNVM